MKLSNLVMSFAAAALLLSAPSIADAQNNKDLLDAAKELEKAAGDLKKAAKDLDAVGADVSGIKAPKGFKGATHGCSKNQQVIVNFKKDENKVLGGKKTKLLIKASGHCNVVIRNVTLRGKVVIDVSGHANVLLKNVTIEGKKTGIEISGHANVKLKDSSVSAGKKAMRISGHANVNVINSTVAGKSSVSGFANVAYDGKSKVGKLKKSGRYATVRKLK